MTPYSLAFHLISFVAVVAALFVVTVRNIFHSALCLILAFFALAGLFILLEAEFVAVAQVLIYVGAITILILFGIMLTHRLTDKGVRQASEGRFISLIVVLVLGALISIVLRATRFPVSSEEVAHPAIPYLGKLLMTQYLWPFEVVSVLLLVALVGAIVIAAKDEVIRKKAGG
jgi:NADH:ubiquinone oxidoreductase subunit 6 (subunit J)